MNPEMKIIREVSNQAENCYDDAVKLGDHAAHTLKAEHRSQMTSLETIAESTFKISDVFDYIKKQTARFPYWRQGFPEYKNPELGFGEHLKSYLEDDLARKRDVICSALKIQDIQERRRIHLLLIRQFIRQMVVEYEYQVSLDSKKR
jgi:hypothetical protein